MLPQQSRRNASPFADVSSAFAKRLSGQGREAGRVSEELFIETASASVFGEEMLHDEARSWEWHRGLSRRRWSQVRKIAIAPHSRQIFEVSSICQRVKGEPV